MKGYFRRTIYLAMTVLFIGGYALLFVGNGLAYVASSTNYRIESDSVNVGGILSTSTNYKMEDTLGETAVGFSTSTSYKLKAGYQQMSGSSISISSAPDILMDPLTMSQNSSVGSTTWNVATDNTAGYLLSVKASASPALTDPNTGESFADYTESSSGVKEQWSVSNAYEFGFSAFGNDVSGYGSGADCSSGTDVPSATLLWEGFLTSNIEMASSSLATPSGTDSTLCVAAEQKSVFAPSGNYATIIIVTAVAQ